VRFFGRKAEKIEKKSYDPEKEEPVIRCGICHGEQVAGFRDKKTGQFQEVVFLQSPADLARFREEYGITGEIEKIY